MSGLGERRSNHPIARVQQSLPRCSTCIINSKTSITRRRISCMPTCRPIEMAKAIKSRGDSGASVFFKVLFDLLNEVESPVGSLAKKGGDFTEFQLLAALFDPNRPLALKRLMADQMELIEGSGTGLGPTLDTILVKDRNEAAMKVLAKEIKTRHRKIAIFYGAAHMPDFDRRLTERA